MLKLALLMLVKEFVIVKEQRVHLEKLLVYKSTLCFIFRVVRNDILGFLKDTSKFIVVRSIIVVHRLHNLEELSESRRQIEPDQLLIEVSLRLLNDHKFSLTLKLSLVFDVGEEFHQIQVSVELVLVGRDLREFYSKQGYHRIKDSFNIVPSANAYKICKKCKLLIPFSWFSPAY